MADETSFSVSVSDAVFLVGDLITYPLPRRWWQFWKPRLATYRVVNVTSSRISLNG